MPEMDGFETTIQIRKTENEARHIPIIALTASVLPEEKRRCFEVGMDDYLTKPLEKNILNSILDRWLPKSRISFAKVSGDSIVDSERSTSDEPNQLDPQVMQTLRRLNDSNKDFLKEIIDIFISESSQRIKIIEKSLDDFDLKAIKKTAHTQKGASLTFGAEILAQLCEKLENMQESDEVDEIKNLADKIHLEFKSVKLLLEKERKNID